MDLDLLGTIEKAEADLQALRKQRDLLKQRLDELNQEGVRVSEMVVALREAANRYGSGDQIAELRGTSPPAAAHDDWTSMGRTAATLRAVAEAQRAVGPTDIVNFLRDKGRTDDTVHLVSAALAHLARHNKVASIGRGQWVPYEQPPDPTLPDPAEDELATDEEANDHQIAADTADRSGGPATGAGEVTG